jgi:hypothetical protein
VNGFHLNGSSVVRWNGLNRATTFVSANQVTASIAAADLTAEGTAVVSVSNTVPEAASSSGVPLTITASTAVIPLSGNECRAGVWQTLVRQDGSSFANQGACVSYGKTGR